MSKLPKTVRAKTSVELCAKIYKAMGRVRREGESQAAFVAEHYDVSVDWQKGDFVAALKETGK